MVSTSKNTKSGLRQQAFSVVSPGSKTAASRIFNGVISILILASVTIIIVNTCQIPTDLFVANVVIQSAISVVFTIEYILRVWTSDFLRPTLKPAKARLLYMVSPAALIDLLAILPAWLFLIVPFDLRFLAAFRVLRVMRLLRLGFYSNALAVVGHVLKASAKQLVATILLLVLLMLIASILMYNAEHAAQPEAFDNALSGFWWAMQTITTIGYGDIYPVTFLGRTLGIVIALLGVGMVAIPTGIISASFISARRKKLKEEGKEEDSDD